MARLSEGRAGSRNALALDNQSAFIYCLKDPRDLKIRYVGKTCVGLKERLHVHLAVAKRHPGRPVCAWIIELEELELCPLMEVLEHVAPLRDEHEREVFWISYMREQGVSLLNCTDGGLGWRGGRHSGGARKKIGDAHRGKVLSSAQRALISERMTGRELSGEHRAKVSAAMKGRSFSEETRRRISDTLRGRPAPMTSGERNGRAVLTRELVSSIRSGGIELAEAINKLGISKTQFYRVKRGEQWGEVQNG